MTINTINMLTQQRVKLCFLCLYYHLLLSSSILLLLVGNNLDIVDAYAFQQKLTPHLGYRYSRFGNNFLYKKNASNVASSRRGATLFNPVSRSPPSSVIKPDDDTTYTIQILMSDTGGGHRASANALRDALDSLYPGKIQCDIVDIFTDYGPMWPFNDYVGLYKFMAEVTFFFLRHSVFSQIMPITENMKGIWILTLTYNLFYI
jgi:hypothetical protein